MSEDMSNLMNQISNMMKNNQIPDDIKNIIQNFSNTSQPLEDTSSNCASSENSTLPEFDIGTMMKMKHIMDAMQTSKDDPRSNLLRSLKPYLKDSRKEKVDQYIQLFGMEKVFGMLGSLGGDIHK